MAAFRKSARKAALGVGQLKRSGFGLLDVDLDQANHSIGNTFVLVDDEFLVGNGVAAIAVGGDLIEVRRAQQSRRDRFGVALLSVCRGFGLRGDLLRQECALAAVEVELDRIKTRVDLTDA